MRFTITVVLDETMPAYWAFNPAYAEVQNTEVWGTAWVDVWGMEGAVSAAL